MTDQEINTAIAKACNIPVGPGEWPVKNYCQDLNAMNEAENQGLKTYCEMDHYSNNLTETCWGKTWEFRTWNTKARQRAEAFLRVKGLWKE